MTDSSARLTEHYRRQHPLSEAGPSVEKMLTVLENEVAAWGNAAASGRSLIRAKDAKFAEGKLSQAKQKYAELVDLIQRVNQELKDHEANLG